MRTRRERCGYSVYMTDHHTEEEKPNPEGDDAVPDSDQVGADPEAPGDGGENPEPVEDGPGGDNA